jgi:hypothetical protein
VGNVPHGYCALWVKTLSIVKEIVKEVKRKKLL